MKKGKKRRKGGTSAGQGGAASTASPFDELPAAGPGKPFHSPFRDLASTLKERRSSQPARTTGAPAPRRPQAPPATSSPSPAPASGKTATASPSDEEILAAALQGVDRLSPLSSRVRVRRRVGLAEVDARIEARRREEVEAMGRGDGFDVTFEDLYVRGRASGVSHETLRRLERGEVRICAHLDLHGLPLEDARRMVDDFLSTQQKRGHRCVLLVTGKGKNSVGGRGVLREQVPQWLARGPSSRRVLAFASARPCDGGLGALVVLLRGSSSSKNRIDVEHGGVGPAGT